MEIKTTKHTKIKHQGMEVELEDDFMQVSYLDQIITFQTLSDLENFIDVLGQIKERFDFAQGKMKTQKKNGKQ
jgi:hypothetical protein